MTTTQHPEQVEVGEIWEYAADLCQDGNGGLVGERRTIVRDRSGGLWASGKEGGTSIDFLIAHARRVEPAKAACKAPEWCGIHKSEPDDRGRDSAFFKSEGYSVEAHEHLFCSRPCADAFVPPLESKPAETGTIIEYRRGSDGVMRESKPDETGKLCNAMMPNGHRCKLNDDHINACSMWRAESAAPPAQEAPKGPVCSCKDEEISCAGPVIQRPALPSYYLPSRPWCDAHWMLRESRIPVTGAGTPYAGPERLERPKLAHSMGVEDPALEDA